MTNISENDRGTILSLTEAILKELEIKKINLFRAKPTVYVTIGKDRLHIALADESEENTKILLSNKKQRSVFDFFISTYWIENSSFLEDHARQKVAEYIAEEREVNAYSRHEF